MFCWCISLVANKKIFLLKLSSCIPNFKFEFCATLTLSYRKELIYKEKHPLSEKTHTRALMKKKLVFNQYVSLSHHACIILDSWFFILYQKKTWEITVDIKFRKWWVIREALFYPMLLFLEMFEFFNHNVCICKS